MPAKLRVLVVGLGHMGVTHAKAYNRIDGYQLAGLCCRSIAKRNDIIKAWPDVARFADYNYGQLQVVFDDGSVGWYEAAWGPQISEVAFFVKDVFGPKGGVHIVVEDPRDMLVAGATSAVSSDIHTHSKSGAIRMHHARLLPDQSLAESDEEFQIADQPDHDEMSVRKQRFLLDAIHGKHDLGDHMRDAVNSLRIVLAADESIRTGRAIEM